MRLQVPLFSTLLVLGCNVYDKALLDSAFGGDGDATGDGDGDGDASSGGDGSGGDHQNGDGGSGDGGSATGGTGGGDFTGGTTGSGGTSGGTGGFPTGTESMLDDFGPPPAYINEIAGRFGSWAVYNDESPEGVMSPGYGDPFHTEPKDGDIENQALHIVAEGFTTWGAGLYVNLNSPSGTPLSYDLLARGYDAIRFIAKRGQASAHNVLRIAIADEHSTTAGSCADPCAQDHPRTQVLLMDDWTEYTIPFSNLNRNLLPTAPDFSSVYEFHLNMDSAQIDFWIDDIRFVDFD
jgi:hypothetical protein